MVTIRSYSLLMIHPRIELFSCFPGINFGRQFVKVLGAVFRNSRFCRLRQDIFQKNPFVLVRCLREVCFFRCFFFFSVFCSWIGLQPWIGRMKKIGCSVILISAPRCWLVKRRVYWSTVPGKQPLPLISMEILLPKPPTLAKSDGTFLCFPGTSTRLFSWNK